LGRLPTPSRLALEMALHEEQERRALEGELKALELAWQEAEEVAAMADDLLLPDRVLRMLGRAERSAGINETGGRIRDRLPPDIERPAARPGQTDRACGM